jgi:hypothetical protein
VGATDLQGRAQRAVELARIQDTEAEVLFGGRTAELANHRTREYFNRMSPATFEAVVADEVCSRMEWAKTLRQDATRSNRLAAHYSRLSRDYACAAWRPWEQLPLDPTPPE